MGAILAILERENRVFRVQEQEAKKSRETVKYDRFLRERECVYVQYSLQRNWLQRERERERERGCYINAGLFSVSVSVSVSVLAVRLLRLSFALE